MGPAWEAWTTPVEGPLLTVHPAEQCPASFGSGHTGLKWMARWHAGAAVGARQPGVLRFAHCAAGAVKEALLCRVHTAPRGAAEGLKRCALGQLVGLEGGGGLALLALEQRPQRQQLRQDAPRLIRQPNRALPSQAPTCNGHCVPESIALASTSVTTTLPGSRAVTQV